MISWLSCTLDTGGFFEAKPDQKVIHISGSKRFANSVLTAVEKCVAEDVSDYYVSEDNSKGVSTVVVPSIVFKSELGNFAIKGSSLTVQYSGVKKYYAVRVANQTEVRLVQSPSCDSQSAERLVVKTKADELGFQNWVRLSKLVNTFANKTVVSVNMQSKAHTVLVEEMSDRVGIFYMLVSECLRSTDNLMKLLLLSNIDCWSDEDYVFALEVLSHIPTVDTIIYHRNFSSTESIGFDLKV